MSGIRINTKRACVCCHAHNVWDRVLYLDAKGDVTTYPARVTCVESVKCLSCSELQPLGPANDSGEAVQVEMRAAELANLLDGWVHGQLHLHSDSIDGAEMAGCIIHDYDSAKQPEQPGEWAGYLARCIAHHDTHAQSKGGES